MFYHIKKNSKFIFLVPFWRLKFGWKFPLLYNQFPTHLQHIQWQYTYMPDNHAIVENLNSYLILPHRKTPHTDMLYSACWVLTRTLNCMMCCILVVKYAVRVTALCYSVIMRNVMCVLNCCIRWRYMGIPYKRRQTVSESDEWRIMSIKEGYLKRTFL